MPNKIKLTVNGVEYCVVSNDGEDYVHALGEELNDRLAEIMTANGFMSFSHAATYAALDLLDDCKKTKMKLAEVENSEKLAREEAVRANLETREAQREIERLNAEILKIRGGR